MVRRDSSVKIGDQFAIEKDGVILTDTIKSFHCQSGSPAIYRTLNRWQWILRRLTPQRWRKSLLIRPAEPASFTINPTDQGGWTQEKIEQIKSAWGR